MTARPASDPDSDRPVAPVASLEPQGERRRRQLVDIAARLIEHEGVDAVRLPRVAELAGFGRTAVYRYFPRREDLLVAVSKDFEERLGERVSAEEFAAGLLALRDASPDAMPAPTQRLYTAIWEVLDQCGPAGLILRAHVASHSAMDLPDDGVGDRFRERWLAFGLGEVESDLVGDAANAILTRLYFAARRGEIEREAAILVSHRAVLALVRGLARS